VATAASPSAISAEAGPRKSSAAADQDAITTTSASTYAAAKVATATPANATASLRRASTTDLPDPSHSPKGAVDDSGLWTSVVRTRWPDFVVDVNILTSQRVAKWVRASFCARHSIKPLPEQARHAKNRARIFIPPRLRGELLREIEHLFGPKLDLHFPPDDSLSDEDDDHGGDDDRDTH
ncbi:hypothetical protein HK405_015913, partial [Cladochytrium tenue]